MRDHRSASPLPVRERDSVRASPRAARVVQIFKDYSALMEKAGVPYRYG